MIPVAQTLFANLDEDGVPGNCLQAAVASLLELPLDEVPHFVGEDAAGGRHWWTHLVAFLRERGYRVVTKPPVEPDAGEMYLGAGTSPRPGLNRQHVAIYRDQDVLVHDPHPDGTGVAGIDRRWLIRPTGNPP